MDGLAGIVAVLISPGDALPGQVRTSMDADYYPTHHLDADNQTTQGSSVNFISQYPADPDSFNDTVITITSKEIMTLITPQIAEAVYQHLENHWSNTLPPSYPADQLSFNHCMTNTTCNDSLVPVWYASDNWKNVTTFNYLDAQNITLQFTGCNILFSLTHNNGVSRSSNSC